MTDPFVKMTQCFSDFAVFRGHTDTVINNLIVEVDESEPSRDFIVATLASVSALIEKSAAALVFPEHYVLSRLNERG